MGLILNLLAGIAVGYLLGAVADLRRRTASLEGEAARVNALIKATLGIMQRSLDRLTAGDAMAADMAARLDDDAAAASYAGLDGVHDSRCVPSDIVGATPRSPVRACQRCGCVSVDGGPWALPVPTTKAAQ